jgi:hypothetical protein
MVGGMRRRISFGHVESLRSSVVQILEEKVQDGVVDLPVFLYLLETDQADLRAVFCKTSVNAG